MDYRRAAQNALSHLRRIAIMSYPARVLARVGVALRTAQVEIVWPSMPLEPRSKAGKTLPGAVVRSNFENQ